MVTYLIMIISLSQYADAGNRQLVLRLGAFAQAWCVVADSNLFSSRQMAGCVVALTVGKHQIADVIRSAMGTADQVLDSNIIAQRFTAIKAVTTIAP